MKKFKSLFTLIAISALTILVITTCTKEYSYEGGPLASYTLVGSPNECTNTIINGVYSAGILLDSLNYVQVTAQVTIPGNYSIITNAIDGITFSSSGNFPDTGLYNVVLKASGTPSAAGTYQLQITGNSTCTFSLVVNTKPMADYVLSGSPTNCESPVIKGNYMMGTPLGSLNTITVNVDVVTTGDYTITTDTLAGIFFSFSGTFTKTGNQQVILTSNGTPNASGLFYFHVYGGNSECVFTMQIVNAQPLATYVLESGFGSHSPCAPQSVNGSYTALQPLSSANTVDITTYVTVPGNFSVSTDSTNGMIFSYSGKFTAAGEQTITLYGGGTPIIPGTYTFSPQIIGPAPLGGASCGFDIQVK